MIEERGYTKKEQYVWHVLLTLVLGDMAPIESYNDFVNRTSFNNPPSWYVWRITKELRDD